MDFIHAFILFNHKAHRQMAPRTTNTNLTTIIITSMEMKKDWGLSLKGMTACGIEK
jgi:hypothetical protein